MGGRSWLRGAAYVNHGLHEVLSLGAVWFPIGGGVVCCGGWCGVLNGGGPARVVRGLDPYWLSGGVLLSHILSNAVPSALWVLASGFGMGPGVSPTL